jgi:aminobenzoyl-glutamate transport protein
MPVAIGFVRKYNKEAGIGTVIANMIPYSATFLVIWLIQLIVWVTLNLPLGPGGGIYL